MAIAERIALYVGDRVRFAGERQRYTVQACNDRFAICTKPFNLLRTVRYTIIDWARGIRGTENLVFGFGAETRAQCEAMLARLTSGETEISSRNWVPLDIVANEPAGGARDAER